jgi:hypothetical protein
MQCASIAAWLSFAKHICGYSMTGSGHRLVKYGAKQPIWGIFRVEARLHVLFFMTKPRVFGDICRAIQIGGTRVSKDDEPEKQLVNEQ